MKDQLNIVRGAVSKKELVPVLTAFHIYDGRLQGMNGFLAIDTSCAMLKEMNITIPAERFMRAVDACENEPELSLTKSSLLVMGKTLKITVPLMPHADFPKQEVEGEKEKISNLLSVLNKLYPFIAEDATRPWACGVMLKNNFAYATNNVSMVKVPFKHSYDGLVIPLHAVNELLRIKQEPTHIFLAKSWITFTMNNCWLKARLIESKWPEVDNLFEKCKIKTPEGLADEVDLLAKFANKGVSPAIAFEDERVTLREGGAEFKRRGLPKGFYRAEPLARCLRAATHMDFSKYPAAVPFKGEDGLMGVLMGLHE